MCVVPCCNSVCDLLEPRESHKPRTCWRSVLDSSVCIGVLFADCNSGAPLFGASPAGKWQEHPSTGCHGNDDLSEGVDAPWVASVEQWTGVSVYHLYKNDYRIDALQFDCFRINYKL